MRGLNRRVLAVLAVVGVLVVGSVPSATAATTTNWGFSEDVILVPVPAPSGDYLDPWSRIVYYYDQGTSALISTNSHGSPAEYFVVDVYDTGQFPDPRTLRISPCTSVGYCLTWLIAMANPLRSQFTLEVINNDTCLVEGSLGARRWLYPDRRDIAFYDTQSFTFGCDHGFAEAAIYVNGQQVAYDYLNQGS